MRPANVLEYGRIQVATVEAVALEMGPQEVTV